MNLPGRKPVTLADVTGPKWSDHHPLASAIQAGNLLRIEMARRARQQERMLERLAELSKRRR